MLETNFSKMRIEGTRVWDIRHKTNQNILYNDLFVGLPRDSYLDNFIAKSSLLTSG